MNKKNFGEPNGILSSLNSRSSFISGSFFSNPSLLLYKYDINIIIVKYFNFFIIKKNLFFNF